MITDFRINVKGELEGKVIPPVKWEEMYTKDEVVAMLTELQLEINEAEMHRYDDQIDKAYNLGLHRGGVIIQQKINNMLRESKV